MAGPADTAAWEAVGNPLAVLSGLAGAWPPVSLTAGRQANSPKAMPRTTLSAALECEPPQMFRRPVPP
jgi:hypothetical protein